MTAHNRRWFRFTWPTILLAVVLVVVLVASGIPAYRTAQFRLHRAGLPSTVVLASFSDDELLNQKYWIGIVRDSPGSDVLADKLTQDLDAIDAELARRAKSRQSAPAPQL